MNPSVALSFERVAPAWILGGKETLIFRGCGPDGLTLFNAPVPTGFRFLSQRDRATYCTRVFYRRTPPPWVADRLAVSVAGGWLPPDLPIDAWTARRLRHFQRQLSALLAGPDADKVKAWLPSLCAPGASAAPEAVLGRLDAALPMEAAS